MEPSTVSNEVRNSLGRENKVRYFGGEREGMCKPSLQLKKGGGRRRCQLTVDGVVQLLLAEDDVAILDGAGVELALPDDLPLSRAGLLVVAFDENVTPQWDAR